MSDTNQNEKGDWKNREIGALWLRKSAAGNKYLSGHVGTAENEGIEDEKTRVIIFANKDKKNDKAPDYRIYKSEPQQNSSAASPEKPSTNQGNDSSNEDDLDVL
jgi:uncharacterized protein (DUF736 family)